MDADGEETTGEEAAGEWCIATLGACSAIIS